MPYVTEEYYAVIGITDDGVTKVFSDWHNGEKSALEWIEHDYNYGGKRDITTDQVYIVKQVNVYWRDDPDE